jgi:hypothetical protein
LKVSETSAPIILGTTFEYIGGSISEPTITTTATKVAESDGNTATITFDPASAIPTISGMIEIETPIWASLYDSESSSLIDYYSMDESDFTCSSGSFTTMTTTIVQEKIQLSYSELING